MTAHRQIQPASAQVLCKALFNTQQHLGLTQETLGKVIGLDRSSVSKLKTRGSLSPDTKEGELATYLIRIYRSLYALMGGDLATMQHWLQTPNKHLHAKPSELLGQIHGLIRTMEYLDAIRGKV